MTTRLGTRRLLLPVVLTAVLTVVLAACSGSTVPSGTANPTTVGDTPADSAPPVAAAASADPAADADPVCKLVTKDDVATAIGYPIATVTGAGGACIFQNADPSKYFAIQEFDTADGMALYLNVESSAQHVAGLGDDAFWASTSGFLFVRKGNRAVLFLNQEWVMTPETDTAHRDSLVTLARAALANL